MTLTLLAIRNTWRNKRRSILTVLSLTFSFLLLTPLAIFVKIKAITLTASFALALAVGVLSAIIPSYRISHVSIVQGLRHIG